MSARAVRRVAAAAALALVAAALPGCIIHVSGEHVSIERRLNAIEERIDRVEGKSTSASDAPPR